MHTLLRITGLLLPVAMLPGLMSAGTVPRWGLLALTLPLMLYWVRWDRVPYKLLLVSILTYAAASTLWAEVHLDAQLGLFRALLLAAAFCVGATCGEETFDRTLLLMSVGVATTLPLVILQVMGYTGIPQTAPPAGLFLNKNVLAESAALLLVYSAYMRRYLLAALLLVIVILAKEKAAFVGLIIVTIVALYPRHRKIALALLGLCAIGVALLIDTPSAQDRLDIWTDTLRGVTFLGNGIGSFYAMFPAEAISSNVIAIRPEQAHNDFLQVLFELGAPGTILIAALAAAAFRKDLSPERLLLVFVLASGAFAFPMHMPLTAFVAALAAGRLCSDVRYAGLEATECRNQDEQSFHHSAA